MVLPVMDKVATYSNRAGPVRSGCETAHAGRFSTRSTPIAPASLDARRTQGVVLGFEYVVVDRFCPLSVSVVTVVVFSLGGTKGPGCVTVRWWTVPLSYCVVVVVAFPLDEGGTGGVVGASYSRVVVVSVTWWVVEQPTRLKIAKPAQPAMAALTARFIDIYSYSSRIFYFESSFRLAPELDGLQTRSSSSVSSPENFPRPRHGAGSPASCSIKQPKLTLQTQFSDASPFWVAGACGVLAIHCSRFVHILQSENWRRAHPMKLSPACGQQSDIGETTTGDRVGNGRGTAFKEGWARRSPGTDRVASPVF
jgi:hypothetical protein